MEADHARVDPLAEACETAAHNYGSGTSDATRVELIEALRVTGEKLDVAYQAVNREAQPATEDGSGV